MSDTYYPPKTVSNVVHEAVEAASMTWHPRPAGAFESHMAAEIAAKLMADLGLNPDDVAPGDTAFESAVTLTPTSKKPQTIIPGAAYLLDNNKTRVWIGGPNNVLMLPKFDGYTEFRHNHEIETATLLYAPGDEVWSHYYQGNDATVVEITRKARDV